LKNLLITLLLILLIPTILFTQSFETDRLPIGDIKRKYDFCSVELKQIFNTKQNKKVSFSEMIEDLKQYRIVMIGETHTNQSHHDVQLKVIKGLVEAGKAVVLALEMYNPKQNEALAAWSSGNTDPNTFLEQTDFLTTWSHNYRYYKAIFDYAREKHIIMYGANVERKYASKIGRGGLGSLSEDDKKNIPEIDTSTIEHKFLIKTMMQGMDATMPRQFRNMYPAQSLWDTAMGEGAIKAAKKHPEATVVVLAGSGHVVYNLGIGRIIKYRSNLSFASVVPVDIQKKVEETGMMKVKKDMTQKTKKDSVPANASHQMKETHKKENQPSAHSMGMVSMDNTPYRIVVRSYADYLWGKKEMEEEKYPALGISLEDDDSKGFQIKRVLPGTIAFENGFQKGDKIISIDGKSFTNSTVLQKYLHFKNWDEQISFTVERDNKEFDISFTVKPVKKED